MPQVTREFEAAVPVEETWDFLMTPERVAPCVPGCESFDELSPDVFEATIAVQVAYTSLTFDAHVELTDKEPPRSAVIEATAEPTGSMPGSAVVTGDIELWPTDDATTSGQLAIDFAIRGRLGSLGESAFAHQCEQLTDVFLASVTEQLERTDAVVE